MAKKAGTKYVVDQFHFENSIKQYINVDIYMEGYIELSIETTQKYAIESQSELDLIYKKLTEALKQSKQK